MPLPKSYPSSVKPPSLLMLTGLEREVMRLLRFNNNISRTDIVRHMGWSRAKVSTLIADMIHKGIISEAGKGESHGGRNPRYLSLSGNLGYIAGIDIGATSLDIALAEISGNIVQHHSEVADVNNPPEFVLNRCSQIIMEMLAEEKTTADKIVGIGIGVPGPVEFSKGALVAPPLMPGWEGFLIREYFKNVFPEAVVIIDNDVNIMALGESYAGNGKGLQNFVYVKVGTGIGSGIISNGRIHRGSTGCAGDIGHICVDKNGPICRCGNVGCLEAMAAGPAMAKRAIQAGQNGASPIFARRMEMNEGVLYAEDVGAAFRDGDRTALEIIQSSGQMIGEVLAALVNFFNPSHIFIGGGVTNLGDQFLTSIRRTVLARSLPLATRHLIIDYSSLGQEAGVKGAISMILDYIFSSATTS